MSAEPSNELRQFIREHIASVAQLEALLLLRSTRAEWTAAAIARELRIDHAAAAEQLRELSDRGLAERIDVPERFRYAPSQPEIDALVAQLESTYEDRRVTIIGIIYSGPAPRVQKFADAFRIRKHSDG